MRVIHWHPPGGKKYFTSHLRIPLIRNGVRRGRYRVDLILADDELLVMMECKCRASQSAQDIQKLREIRDRIGLAKLVELFTNQGTPLPNCKHLMIGIGVKYIDAPVPEDLFAFRVSDGIQRVFGSRVAKEACMLFESLLA